MKKVNWGNDYKPPVVNKRGQTESARQAFARANETHTRGEDLAQQYAQFEPFLHKALTEIVKAQQPITIIAPFRVKTQLLQKSEGQYTASAKYLDHYEVLQKGETLEFVTFEPRMKNLVLKSQSGNEIEIYLTPLLARDGVMAEKNSAYYGLLLNTSVFLKALELAGGRRG